MTAARLFQHAFGVPPAATASAPGRVNLIGEHTDYNGGFVLPVALPLRAHVALGPSDTPDDEIVSDAFPGVERRALHAPAEGRWSDYASGALQAARERGWLKGAARLAITSDVPPGAGLSSSAALLVAILRAAALHSEMSTSVADIALRAQSVERDHIGVPCGVMDHMAASIDAPGSAILLDTQNLKFELVALPRSLRIIVLHSGVTRKLSDGRYAQRRQECEDAARRLGAEHLCLLTDEQRAAIAALPQPLARRARHAADEQDRVNRAVAALRNGDDALFGSILVEGHQSLRDNFEVSTPEIDRLVEISVNEGAVGARLTGGGFGGCVVVAVPDHAGGRLVKRIIERAPGARFICEIAGGRHPPMPNDAASAS